MDDGRECRDGGGDEDDAAPSSQPPLEEVDVLGGDIDSGRGGTGGVDGTRRDSGGRAAGGGDRSAMRRPPSGAVPAGVGVGFDGEEVGGMGHPPVPGGDGGAMLKDSPSHLTVTTAAASTSSTCSVSTAGSLVPSTKEDGGGGGGGTQQPRRQRVQMQPQLAGLRRRQRRRRGRPNPESLLLRQLQLLSALSASSLLLFLVFYLSLPALILLSAAASLSSLLTYTAYRYAMLRYNRTVTEGGFLQYMPEGMQRALTTTTLHEWMTDPAAFLEYRYLLLYFIPGLSPEQLEAMARNLPPRHRDVLLRPGYMRPALPEGARRALLPEEGDVVRARGAIEVERNLGPGGGDRGGVVVRQRGLPELENDDDDSDGDDEATLQDAVDGIFRAVTALLRSAGVGGGTAMPSIVEEVMDDEDGNNVVARAPPTDMDWDGDDDGAAAPSATAGGLPPPASAPRSPPPIIEASAPPLSSSRSAPPPPPSQRNRELQRQRELQDEQDQEERLLSDAVSVMINNYTSSATTAVTTFVRDAVERFAPRVMRLGVTTSLSSGLGLLALRLFERFIVAPRRRIGGDVGGQRQPAQSAVWGWYGTAATYGLMGTMVSGTAVAGFAWAARRGVRSYVAFSSSAENAPSSSLTATQGDGSDAGTDGGGSKRRDKAKLD